MFKSSFRPNGGVSVIAEPANSHNGSSEYLSELIEKAKECGADAIKFQLIEPDHLSVPDFEWYKVYQQIAIPTDRWVTHICHAKAVGLNVIAEVFDVSMARFCLEQGIRAFKLNIADVSSPDLIHCLADAPATIFLSVGGSLVKETEHALQILTRRGNEIVLNYGFQNYPTALSHSNLAKIRLFLFHFGLPVCFADHLAGDHPMAIELPCLAVTAGATVIEKHFILERKQERYDYYSAIEPHQFKTMVDRLRDVETCLGLSSLDLDPAELEYRNKHKKCPVLKDSLPAGHCLVVEDIQFKRANQPKDFLSLEEVVGKSLAVAVPANVPLRKEHLK